MEHDNLLEGRIDDLSKRAYNNDYLTCTNFLSASDLALFYRILKSRGISSKVNVLNGSSYVVYGGHEDADRNVICFLPGYMSPEEFSVNEALAGDIIKCIHVKPLNNRFADDLSHRDFLGALMNLGIEREKIGDILVDGSSAYIFVLSDMAETVARELTRVKHTSVDCGLVSPSECDVQPKFIEVSGSVASQRVDAVLAMVWHLSRGRAQEVIKAENVFINGQTVTDPGYNLKPGDRVTVRGHGKFIFESTGTMTKKGRFYANVRVYS